jgi:hypothetical protein
MDCLPARADVEIQRTGNVNETVHLTGMATVRRSDPKDVDANGGWDVLTEIVSLELAGQSEALFGPTVITSNPNQRLPGVVQQRSVGQNFPADGIFDVFLTVQSPFGSLGANSAAVRLVEQGGVGQVVPNSSEEASYAGTMSLGLTSPFSGQNFAQVVSLTLTFGAPQPCPTTLPTGRSTINALGEFAIQLNGGSTILWQPTGQMTIEHGASSDSDGDGLPDAPTELVSIDITGTFDPDPQNSGDEFTMRVTQSAAHRSLGQTEQGSNQSPFPAGSFFDAFFDIEIKNVAGQVVAHFTNSSPVRLQNVLHGSTFHTPYCSASGVGLVDVQTGQNVGTLFAACLMPN